MIKTRILHSGLALIPSYCGRYALADYSGKPTCATTYTCEYGLGFDQVGRGRYRLLLTLPPMAMALAHNWTGLR
jgi:hypothetical protein